MNSLWMMDHDAYNLYIINSLKSMLKLYFVNMLHHNVWKDKMSENVVFNL